MDNILAAHVLMSHLPEIKDGAYKTATEIAIETLFKDAMCDYYQLNTSLTPNQYLELTYEQYEYWILCLRRK